jgi:hypothetical protein
MGTWDAGPFNNDAALDYVGTVLDGLMGPVDAFLASPAIDNTFDAAFAAIALLNEVMDRTPSRPWDAAAGDTRDPEPIVSAMLSCFDGQIDAMQPTAAFRSEHRASLVRELERFRALMKD